MFENKDFILSSIDTILEESIAASMLACRGIEGFPMQDYVLQTTFLKMTGYSEQKLKCILWDIASADYDFRYQVYQNWEFGECSNLKDKTKAYKKLVEKIKEYDDKFDVKIYIRDLHGSKNKILTKNYENCKSLLETSQLKYFNERDYNYFVNDTETFSVNQDGILISSKDSFLNNKFKSIYEELYRERNRCAHNLKSYQQHLPKITRLLKKKNTSNYFYYFTILMLIDEIFVRLYEKLVNLMLENNW